MTDTTLTQAIREAYAAAPANVVIYHTLELWHSAFTTPIRVVRDYADLTATLESTAPRNPSTAVTFVAFNFDFTKPEVSATGVPQITITLDNADRAIVANIEAAMGSTELVSVIYREFISTDLSAPQNNPPLAMTILNVVADVFKVTATAGFPNLMNKRFPTTEYSTEVFVGLSA
ncbi:MAG: DUF1833 family protein [Rhodoferax sp.]|uniref:DUF1833 family protein n=1 Tax=Rhodoferax sp. TaxID=50421 RepID=UPI002730565D|nr:DUF1833 family protein [Rhodoferax sp.]MDP1530310.1 DUF1833 family protein [Rhodoferax sp.]MDP1943343.1 DUF1833 family protein [Rhodoferax sp.]MDP3831015.1 DUF1833 family protein [Ignavibacteriaceae bacterium]